MKYGYLFYKKPLITDMPTRPVNLGDPIQSYAVKLLYKEMGIEERDMIPVDRYDMKTYDGEECICVVNTCSTYEELAYDSGFMPPSDKIHAIPFSLHINRHIADDELEFYRSCLDVGCRDVFTENKLSKLGVRAYLTGCLSLTFPRRSREQEIRAKDVYLIDVQPEFRELIPKEILRDAIELSSIYRFEIKHNLKRMTEQEASEYHRMGEERIKLLRDTAKLVITTRLHAAAPCLAMGIPVIMTKHDDRFGFIDRFLPSYTSWDTDIIDWDPKPVDIEAEKRVIKQAFFDRVIYEKSRLDLAVMWNSKSRGDESLTYVPAVRYAIESISFRDPDFEYAVLGVVSSVSYFIPDIIQELYPDAKLICGIDSYVKTDFFGKKTISPEEILQLDNRVIIITAIQGAYEASERYIGERPHIYISGRTAECWHL